MTGNKLFDMIIVGILSLVTLSTLGVFVYTEVIYKKPEVNEQAENKKMLEQMKKKTFAESFKIKKMIINLPNRTSKLRFLEITPYIIAFKNKTLDRLNNLKPQIKDTIITVVGSISPDELNSVTGKILLQAKLKDEIDKILGYPGVKQVIFTRFVVQ